MNFSPITSKLPNEYKKNVSNAYNSKEEFDKYEDNKNIKKNNAKLALKGDQYKLCENNENDNELAHMFFSAENTQRIQRHLKQEVINRTHKQFRLDEDQDELDLLVAMRAVFKEEARFLPFKLKHQVKDLNRKLINYIIPDMITEIKQNYNYQKEINNPIKPIIRPLNVNNAGRRTLPSLTSAWNF